MAVGFKVGFFWYQIGRGDFLHSFFSTVAYNLENKKWGSRYPIIMNELYQGKVEYNRIEFALKEIGDISNELKRYPICCVIWDIEDITKQPPWGKNISKDITDLSNYFVTSDGEDFITIMQHALEKAMELKMPIEIQSI